MEVLKEATKKRLATSEKRAFFILIFFSAASYFFTSKKFVLGVLIGGGLSLLNIIALSKIGENVFKQSSPRKTPAVIAYLVKIIILFGVLFFLITHELINIFAFIIGFSVILLIIGLEIIFPSQKTT